MKYFSQFPTITTTDYKGNSINVANILIRTEMIPNLLNNTLLFYNYDIQDGDSPDIIAHKYYEDVNKFWLLPYSNSLIDPQAEWPMNQSLFNDYIIDKYTQDTANYYSIPVANVTPTNVLAYTQTTVKNYIKSVTTTDSYSNISDTTLYYIDETAYNNSQASSQIVSFPDGSAATIQTTLYTQSIFDYEISLNEAKRNVNILNKDYAGRVEKQLSALMKA